MTDQEFKKLVADYIRHSGDSDSEAKILTFCEDTYASSFIDNVYEKVNSPKEWLVATATSYCIHAISKDQIAAIAIGVPLSAVLSELYQAAKKSMNGAVFDFSNKLDTKPTNPNEAGDSIIIGVNKNVVAKTPDEAAIRQMLYEDLRYYKRYPRWLMPYIT